MIKTDGTLNRLFDSALIRLLEKRAFFYEVLLRFDRIPSKDVPAAGVTIGTDDLRPKLYTNMEGLLDMFEDCGVNTDERNEIIKATCGVLEHEMLHFCNGHIASSPRAPSEDEYCRCKSGYNICMDYSINQIIHWGECPLGEEITKRNKGIITEYSQEPVQPDREWEYYWRLIKDNIPKTFMCGSGGGQFDDHDWEGKLTPEQQEIYDEIRKRIVRDSYETAQGRGEISGAATELYKRVHSQTLSWKRIIRRFAREVLSDHKETYRRPSRRTQQWPGSVRETKSRFVLAIDASSSVSGELFSKFIEEIKRLCFVYNVGKFRFVEIDADIQVDEEISPKDLRAGKIEIKGRGGTVMKPLFDKLKSERSRTPVILFTDGHTDSFPNRYKFSSLWVISPRGSASNAKENDWRFVRMKGDGENE